MSSRKQFEIHSLLGLRGVEGILMLRAEAQGEMEPLSLKDVEKSLARIAKVLESLEQKIDFTRVSSANLISNGSQ